MRIIRGPHTVSDYPDPDGNYRALNPKNPGFVGYGRTQEEAGENLSKAIREGKQANPRAVFEASFMAMSEAEQEEAIANLPSLRRS